MIFRKRCYPGDIKNAKSDIPSAIKTTKSDIIGDITRLKTAKKRYLRDSKKAKSDISGDSKKPKSAIPYDSTLLFYGVSGVSTDQKAFCDTKCVTGEEPRGNFFGQYSIRAKSKKR